MRIQITPEQNLGRALGALKSGARVELAGDHRLEAPVVLKNLADVEIQGVDGASLSGARRARVCWQACEPGVFCAKIAVDRPVDALRIGGARYHMARYPHAVPDGGYFGGWRADCLDFAAKCAHPQDGFFHAMHSHLWGSLHHRILGLDERGAPVLEGGWQNNRPMGLHPEYRYVENLREALGAAGEFYYDPRESALYVCAAQMPDSEIELVVNPYLLRLEGCRNVRLSNLRFCDSARTFMAEYEPLLRSDWRVHRGAALFLKDCDTIAVEDCDFAHIGSNALFVSGGSQGACVRDCHFHHIGASCALFVGEPESVRCPQSVVDIAPEMPEDIAGVGPRGERYVRDCRVESCLMHDFGLAEKQVAGVEISMAARIRVQGCSIYRCPRAGINIGDGTFGGHEIEENDVFDTVRESSDHGSFNSWGRDRFWHLDMPDEALRALAARDAAEPTRIANNRMRCDHGWDIDLDDGSARYIIENNLCLKGGIKLREGFDRVCRGNLTVNNTLHLHVWYGRSGDVLEGNLLCAPYAPISMPERWGERVDGNLLCIPGAQDSRAAALSDISGQDEHSLVLDARFRNPAGGDFAPLHPQAAARFMPLAEYGVTRGRLRALAERCPIPALNAGGQTGRSAMRRWRAMLFKDVETDAEMSAFATPGRAGALVVDMPFAHAWGKAGLQSGRAITAFNGEPVQSARDLVNRLQSLKPGETFTLLSHGTRGERDTLTLKMLD